MGQIRFATRVSFALPATAVGDRLVLTSNDHGSGRFNGMAGDLRPVSKTSLSRALPGDGNITFDPRRYSTFDYGYAGTIHRGQGRTFDETFLLCSRHRTRRASYVALTRHRETATVFVDANEPPTLGDLAGAMARSNDRPNAIELAALA